ncbi:hypothetical protein DFJ73DRAFT_59732 [Zopfochytrium polystomum]|nr:hypothetical protein DFJ73DRAFT_59732 [Zopfochytrium polystomum]
MSTNRILTSPKSFYGRTKPAAHRGSSSSSGTLIHSDANSRSNPLYFGPVPTYPAAKRALQEHALNFDSESASPASKIGAADEKWRSMIESIRKKNRLSNPFLIWREFPTQDAAMSFLSGSNKTLMIFSYEFDVENPGKRRFVCASKEGFWNRYIEMSRDSRTYYELIPEGSPCHLYFDLEYKFALNPHLDPNRMMKAFKQLIAKQLQKSFGVIANYPGIVDLVSSSTEKFSRHLVVRIPNALWKNNAHIGRFVDHLCLQVRLRFDELGKQENRSAEEAAELEDLSNLFVATDREQSEKTLFIDTGVYTRNRNFRMFLSTKIGKSSFLVPSQECGTWHQMLLERTIPREELDPAHLLEMDKEPRSETSALWRAYWLNSLVVGYSRQNTQCPLFLEWGGAGASIDTLAPPRSLHSVEGRRMQQTSEPDAIADFISEWIFNNHTNKTGNIVVRPIDGYGGDGVRVYGITGTRYCERIRREHRSNGIYYVVELETGIARQKCHDPDCRNFQSSGIKLPTSTAKALRKVSK